MTEDFSSSEGAPKLNFPEITSLEMSSSELHEMFLALTWSGFSEKQALYIIGVAVSGGILSPYRHVSEEDDFDLSDDDENDDFDDQDI